MFPGLSTFRKYGKETMFPGLFTFRKHSQETMFSGLSTLRKHSQSSFFHFNRIVAKRSVFHCVVNNQSELMTWTQKNTLRFATIRLKWKATFRNYMLSGLSTFRKHG